MEEVKLRALEIFVLVKKASRLPKESRIPITLNFAFMGNPGRSVTVIRSARSSLCYPLLPCLIATEGGHLMSFKTVYSSVWRRCCF